MTLHQNSENMSLEVENSEIKTVKTLFTICIEYVSVNIHLVDSLDNFPEILAENIYEQCLKTDIFSTDNSNSQYVIRLFVNAYRTQFMNSLSISNQRLVNEFNDCLCILTLPVTKLDLSGCLLGNNNDILKIFVEMACLKSLNLAQNEISDDGFRSILARHRIFKKGFQCLENLDVSENVVSLKVLKSLLGLPSLKSIKLSMASCLKLSNKSFIKQWKDIIIDKGYQHSGETDTATDINTEGWGAKIVSIWEKKATEWEIERLERINRKSQSFYANSLKRVNLSAKQPRIEMEQYDTFVYIKNKLGNYLISNETISQNCSQKSSVVDSNRHKADLSSEIIQNHATNEELDMLRIYMKI